MRPLLAAIDQGTSSTKVVLLDRNLEVVAFADQEVNVSHPRPGWVEQDPEELWSSVLATMREALAGAGASWGDVSSLGLTNQTETFLLWERATGRPAHQAIGWQCRRSASICAEMVAAGHGALFRERTGLELEPPFPASKLKWLFETRPELGSQARAGALAYGDVGSWILWRLCGGQRHVTDASNASRSGLFDLRRLRWDDELLELFGVPPSLLPEVLPSAGEPIATDPAVVAGSVSVGALLGDQQASLFGHGCWLPGETKATLGTGAFVWANAGPEMSTPPDGVLATCAWLRGPDVTYAMEGFVPSAGAVLAWLRAIGLVNDYAEVDALGSVPDGESAVVCVPALHGLGTPSWHPSVTGAFLGLTAATSRAELVRGALDGVVHQVADAVEAVRHGSPTLVPQLSVDGGLARSSWLVQRLADFTGTPVRLARIDEVTAFGAAVMAAIAGDQTDADVVRGFVSGKGEVEPSMPAERRLELRERWKRSLETVAGWQ